jgi:integrase/recombinase XerD
VTLERATEDYLAYLRVERGLADATIRAYRGDLRDFAASLGPEAPAWGRSAEPAVRYLASRTSRGRAGVASLAPSSLRRRAAALKGFYRFAFGEGLIEVDVATQLDLPRQGRRLPDTLSVAEVERLLEGASEGGPRDRALLELLYAAGLRVSEAVGLDREDLSLDGGFVRVIGKGDKERLVPIGEVAVDRLVTWLDGLRPALVGRAPGGPVARPSAPTWERGSARTRSATPSRRICSRAEPTCGSSRSCSDMRVSPRPSSTRT